MNRAARYPLGGVNDEVAKREMRLRQRSTFPSSSVRSWAREVKGGYGATFLELHQPLKREERRSLQKLSYQVFVKQCGLLICDPQLPLIRLSIDQVLSNLKISTGSPTARRRENAEGSRVQRAVVRVMFGQKVKQKTRKRRRTEREERACHSMPKSIKMVFMAGEREGSVRRGGD